MRASHLAAAIIAALAIGGCGDSYGLRVESPTTGSQTTPSRTAAVAVDPTTGEIASGPGCRKLPRATRRRLGKVAYIRHDSLLVTSLADCRTRTLVKRGAEGPVRYSPSGRWIAYGNGTVVSADGHSVLRPLGTEAVDWTWVRHRDNLLAGVTDAGGVVAGRPGATPQRMQPEGWGALDLVADPAQSTLAIARGGDRGKRPAQIWTADPTSGHPRLAYQLSEGAVSVKVAGFAPDGQILFWPNPHGSSSLAADGFALRAVTPGGRQVTTVTSAMLLNRDWIAGCKQRLVLAVGGDRRATVDKALALAGPPDLRVAGELLAGGSRSWISPDCTHGGQIIVAAAGPSRDERSAGDERRSIWRLSLDSARRTRLTPLPPAHISDEDPRVSPDGKWVLFVRSGPLRDSRLPGHLYLASIDGSRIVGPLAAVGPGSSYYGAPSWHDQIDWLAATNPLVSG